MNISRITFYNFIWLFFPIAMLGQVGIGTSSPTSSAILELNSTNQGLLFNKIALQGTNLAAPLTAHQQGMWVYNTATTGTHPNNVVPGLYYNDGTKWIIITASESFPKIGDIKPSMNITDHNGWYILDGRSIATISSTNARQNAINIGFSSVLPNATDRILKGKSTTEQFASIGGRNALRLTQANLPNFSLTGNTNASGAHSHGIAPMGDSYWNWTNSSSPKVIGLRTVQNELRTTASSGSHSHGITIPSGGTASPISNYPKNMTVVYFIYLGK